MIRKLEVDPATTDASVERSLRQLAQECRRNVWSRSALRTRWTDLNRRLPVSIGTPSSWSEEYAGDPCPQSAMAYHAECLSTIDWHRSEPSSPGGTGFPLKILYHLRMLELAIRLSSDEALSEWPTVTVALAYEDPSRARRSLDSCLNQTHPPAEILVVGPRPPEDTRDELPSTVHWIVQPGITPADARNLALENASGDFIHFLDDRRELQPNAIERKLQVFHRVPSARFVYSPEESEQASESGNQAGSVLDDRSFVGDPMLAAVTRIPFSLGTVLMPLWFARQVGPFENELGRWEEARYALRAALHGVKAIALRSGTTRRIPFKPPSHRRLAEEAAWAVETDLLSAAELARSPRMYRYLAPLLTRATQLLDAGFENGMSTALYEDFHERIVAFEAGVGSGKGVDGQVAILLDQLLFSVRRLAHPENGRPCATALFHRDREDRLLDRIEHSPRVSGADLRRWLPEIPPQPFALLTRGEKIALRFALDQLQNSVLLGEISVQFRALHRVGIDYPGHPFEEDWNGFARLERVLGEHHAKRFYRQKIIRSGWHWLGQARRLLKGEPILAAG
ncbi:MAG: glycosyltransferase family 2 protein [Planctomycetota bacterium]